MNFQIGGMSDKILEIINCINNNSIINSIAPISNGRYLKTLFTCLRTWYCSSINKFLFIQFSWAVFTHAGFVTVLLLFFVKYVTKKIQ